MNQNILFNLPTLSQLQLKNLSSLNMQFATTTSEAMEDMINAEKNDSRLIIVPFTY